MARIDLCVFSVATARERERESRRERKNRLNKMVHGMNILCCWNDQ